ncbi:hypothetical protein DYB31_005228, partial [Aphanomyces astaci]
MAAPKSSVSAVGGLNGGLFAPETSANAFHEYKYFLSNAVDCEVMFFLSSIDLPPAKLVDVSSTTSSSPLAPQQNLHQMLGTMSELRNSPMSEVFVTAQIFADGIPMHPMTINTKYPSQCKESSIIWSEWLTLPMKFKDLPRNAVIALTLWGVNQVPIGGTTIAIFAPNGCLKDGTQCLRVWPGVAADPQLDTTTPSDYNDPTNDVLTRQMECFRLDKARERYERRDMQRSDWMDRVTNRRISRIRRSSDFPGPKDDLPSFCQLRDEPCLWIELPYFGQTVVYEEEPYALRNAAAFSSFAYGDAKAPSTANNNTNVLDLPTPSAAKMPTMRSMGIT